MTILLNMGVVMTIPSSAGFLAHYHHITQTQRPSTTKANSHQDSQDQPQRPNTWT
jgi:hypothetical protein